MINSITSPNILGNMGSTLAGAKAGDANDESFIRMLTLLSYVSAE